MRKKDYYIVLDYLNDKMLRFDDVPPGFTNVFCVKMIDILNYFFYCMLFFDLLISTDFLLCL